MDLNWELCYCRPYILFLFGRKMTMYVCYNWCKVLHGFKWINEFFFLKKRFIRVNFKLTVWQVLWSWYFLWPTWEMRKAEIIVHLDLSLGFVSLSEEDLLLKTKDWGWNCADKDSQQNRAQLWLKTQDIFLTSTKGYVTAGSVCPLPK